MSSSSREVTGKKKKDVWQEAGGEFYHEQYPCGSGQAASTVDLNETTQRRVSRPHIPLPSQTARRNSVIPTGGRKYFTRKQSLTATATATVNQNHNNTVATNCMTYTSTMAGGINGNDIHVALMPDLADETIPNEKSTYEALIKIKVLPEPMAQKRLRKAKLTGIPKLRLHGWRMIKWEMKKGIASIKHTLRNKLRNTMIFKNSLRQIEVKCGTAILDLFLFIKWTLFLNLAMSAAIAKFIIFPYYALSTEFGSGQVIAGSNCTELKSASEPYTDSHQLKSCCTKAYQNEANNSTTGSLGELFRFVFGTNGSIENTPFFYGYYIHQNTEPFDVFAVIYILVFTSILLLSLAFMIRSLGSGIKEIILAGEGEFYKYSNLIFSGWDHYTKDDAGSTFKKKILRNEMKVALKTEKRNLESLIQSRKQQAKVNIIRIFINLIVIILLLLAGTAVYQVTDLSIGHQFTIDSSGNDTLPDHVENLVYSFAPSIAIVMLNLVSPIVLARLGKLEKYPPETEMGLVLIRALFIRLVILGFAAFRIYSSAYCQLQTSEYCTKCRLNLGPFFTRIENRSLCWESTFADHIYRLLLIDLSSKILLTFFLDPFRLLFKRLCSAIICRKIGIIKFNIVRHTLDIIYLQVLSWVGMYFGPFIPFFAVIYCYLIFYLKKYSVLFNCTAVPHTYRTMRTTTILVAAQLIAFVTAIFVNVSVLGYMTPSKGCGPFRDYENPWEAVLFAVRTSESTTKLYEYISTPGITAPMTAILLLISYYFYSVAHANRGMVDTLRHLLVLEGHDKQYLFGRLNSLQRHSLNSGRSDSPIHRED